MGIPFPMFVFGLPVAVMVFVIVLRVGLLKGLLGSRKPKFTGAPLIGTGQVVSVQPTGSSIQRGGLPPEYRCRIALRVDVPGREPYGVTVDQLVDSMVLPNLRPGTNVVVQVDSANPANIHVDFSQPVTPAA